MTAAVVGPVRPEGVVAFRGGPGCGLGASTGHVAYTPPVDTCDSRYEACTEHRVACDCREAEWAELRQEYCAERRYVEAAFARVLAGHPIRVYGDTEPCQCTGCQIARAAGIYPARLP